MYNEFSHPKPSCKAKEIAPEKYDAAVIAVRQLAVKEREEANGRRMDAIIDMAKQDQVSQARRAEISRQSVSVCVEFVACVREKMAITEAVCRNAVETPGSMPPPTAETKRELRETIKEGSAVSQQWLDRLVSLIAALNSSDSDDPALPAMRADHDAAFLVHKETVDAIVTIDNLLDRCP